METKILNYRIIIEPEKYEDGSTVYVASCPSLSVYDYGNTVEEALESIKDGIKLAVKSLAKDKKDVPVDNIENQIITNTQIKIPSGFNISFA